ncbi:MAG: TonB-dependent receptor [candidate division KSB1 bacterium]|nr:TonB-dependent receptor [candidate division KSB1 bacterium]MDZ7274636.1 TonB-dependent receptor [candidate division KSB1 bacterium]MDZ7285461.1 TonB-dependent receptor [candidate division KSB1 bacterium]MDZ7298493.1 TonB-dependent receptor [candidate division KSB1 bacterium]MDZ7306283.1 TonB-dependent receptor [candidate division KSB1 bacterium]
MIKRILSTGLLVWLAFAPAQAGTTGKIAGRVVDKTSKAPLPGASVQLEGTTLGAAADHNGAFVILNIPPGTYSARVNFIGYDPVTIANVRVAINQTTTLHVELNESLLEGEEVVVVAERPLVRQDATGTVAIVGRDDIQALPVRDFVEVLQLRAGVVGEGNNINIRGGRSNEVAYLVDGVYIEDPLFGGLGTRVHNDAIEQLEFLSGTFSAEFGDALSGVVNIVTREGGGQFTAKLDGRTSEFAAPYSHYDENRVIISLGGPLPLLPNLTFFVSGESDRRGSWLPFGYNREFSTLGKLSQKFSSALKATLSYRLTRGGRQSYSHAWKYIPEQYAHSRTHSDHAVLTLKHVLSNKAFYDLKLSSFRQSYRLGVMDANDNFLPPSQYLATGDRVYLPTAGNGFEFYARAHPLDYLDSHTKTLNARADWVWQAHPSHELKAGLELKRHDLRLYSIYDPRRNFPYINDYTRKPVEAAAYVQDKMEFASLILNAGLRLDFADQRAPFRANPLDPQAVVAASKKWQISPRLGIAHPITERTNFHFSYGHFFQNPEYQFLYENSQYDLNVREPLFGQPDLEAQKTVAYEVGVAHQLTPTLAASLTAYYKDVTGLIGTHYYFPYFDGRFVGYTLYVNEDYANIKGFEVDVTLRRTKNFAGGLTYTYSVAKGSASSETEQYPGTQESTLLYYLDFDKTHVINLNTSLSFKEKEGPRLFGMQPLARTYWNVVLRTSSGYPYTPGGRDAGFVIRNSERMPWTLSLDAEVGKDWRLGGFVLTVFAEALNLTNYKNVLSVYSDTGLPDVTRVGNNSPEYIRDPSNFGPPRRVRLGLRLQR